MHYAFRYSFCGQNSSRAEVLELYGLGQKDPGQSEPGCTRLEPAVPFFGNRIRRPVAGCAILRSGLVKQNRLRFDGPSQFVTLGTTYVLMGATQRKFCPLFVIEQ